jgi:hypothetical protein
MDFYIFILNEINDQKQKVSPFNVSKIWKRLGFDTVENIMSKHTQFERILNVNNLVMEKNTGTDVEVQNVNEEYYKYVLEVIFHTSLKIAGNYKLQRWIDLYKGLISYKHLNALS